MTAPVRRAEPECRRPRPATTAAWVVALAVGVGAPVGLAGCAASTAGGGRAPIARQPPPSAAPADLAGVWRAVLASPGGELPFALEIRGEGQSPPALARNGAESVPFTLVRREGTEVVLALEGYDSVITATLSPDGATLQGQWSRRAAGGKRARLPFSARRDDRRRFDPALRGGPAPGARVVPDVSGGWLVRWQDEDGEEVGRGELRQAGERLEGTFLTPTGDHRFLEGDYAGGRLRLSCFDGSHAFLFHAEAQADGTLRGDWWSRDTYHATWTARRAASPDEGVPDAYGLAGVRSADGRLRFSFPDLEGHAVSLDDDAFRSKVVVVNVFGSWCPNCNDEAPLLVAWHERFAGQGLALVGVAYEMTGDPDADRDMVRRYRSRHGTPYPLLLGGTSDKVAASQTLPDLSRVAAFPTTVFIGRDGRVRKVYSGYSGPGTGERHAKLRAELEALIRALLAEPTPPGERAPQRRE